MPSEKITISNVNQFMGYAKKVPAVLNVGGLFAFRSYLTVVTNSGCAKCNQNATRLAALRPQFEATMSVLNEQEKNRLKTLLDTKKICFWTKAANGQLLETCF